MTYSRRAQEVLEWAVRRRLGSMLRQASAAEADTPLPLLAEAAAVAAGDEGATAVADEGASSSNSMRARDEMHRALLEAGASCRWTAMQTYADVCRRMLTYACWKQAGAWCRWTAMLTYADVCRRMQTYA